MTKKENDRMTGNGATGQGHSYYFVNTERKYIIKIIIFDFSY